MEENRGAWYLLTGVVLGLVLGLVIIWLRPVEYVDTSPSSLRADFKDRYRALIAAAYLSDGDVVRARARLELLGDTDAFRALAEQAQRTLAEGNSPQESRALGLLAVALNPAGGQTLPARIWHHSERGCRDGHAHPTCLRNQPPSAIRDPRLYCNYPANGDSRLRGHHFA